MVHRVDRYSDTDLVVVVGYSKVTEEGVTEDDRCGNSICGVIVLINGYHALNSRSRGVDGVSSRTDSVLLLV
jgi:hypothetical protein